MYKTPVKIFKTQGEIVEEYNKELDRMIFEEIHKVGIFVDKEELIRAMNYDRQQYDKGYADGKADAIDEIHTELITEIAMLNETDMTSENLYTFAVRIKEITEKLISK